MNEFEYKALLTEVEYDRIRDWAESCYYNVMRKILQINYYYDTPDFFFNRQGITVRIRQKDGMLKGTVKDHSAGKNELHSKEIDFPAKHLPQSILYQNQRLILHGQFVTERIDIPLQKKVHLMIDRSHYMGQTDFEAELEFSPSRRKVAETFAEELFRTVVPKERQSKSERFYRSLQGKDESGAIILR